MIEAAYRAIKMAMVQPRCGSRDRWLRGECKAQALMGLIYHNGRGAPKNEQEAATWFGLAQIKVRRLPSLTSG